MGENYIRDTNKRPIMNAEDFERFEYLKNQIELSEGWKIEMGIRNVERILYIFRVNYNHLKGALELFDSDAGSKLWYIKNRNKMDLFQREVIRMFHNFLASVKSLVDLTRNIVNEIHIDNEFKKEYDLKKDAVFVNSELSIFVQDLRNYMLLSMAIQKSPTMAIKFPQVYLRLLHFAVQA